ncbi:hypothetical protein CDV36_013004 [Fusarium kuroshium]|uniref:Uncharacterized protein n=1 Tax=Fusarium kuroshium TaxID=2010991 RepID=A0A3M2RQB5_9HYPO|nr:hypothetical protein CDV36_013004 [Fusarium kuroshium]
MSYPNTRSWAKQQRDQNESPHNQGSSSSVTGKATTGGSANLTPSWSSKDQGMDGQETKSNIVSRTTLKPRPAPLTMSSGPPTSRPTNGDLLGRLTMTKAPWETRNVSTSPSPVSSIPSSRSINGMMMNRQMQHDGKDPYNFYEDNDSEKEIDYPSTPSYSDSSSNSRPSSSSSWSTQSNRSERGRTPTYDESGCRLGNFFTTQRR